jgi:hypothetical protein
MESPRTDSPGGDWCDAYALMATTYPGFLPAVVNKTPIGVVKGMLARAHPQRQLQADMQAAALASILSPLILASFAGRK